MAFTINRKKLSIVFFLDTVCLALSVVLTTPASLKEETVESVYYFAYGSNLLLNRIRINVPVAKFHGVAKLKDWRLEFRHYENNWRGAVATIVPETNSTVWGTLWNVYRSFVPSLDKQEGVDQGWYYPRNITVTVPQGQNLTAMVYIQTPQFSNSNDTLPSRTYQMVMVLGAIEHKLPADYVNYLSAFENNRQIATLERRQQLGYPFYDSPA